MPASLGYRFRILFWLRLLPAWRPSAALGFVVGEHSAFQPSRWSTTALSLSCSQTLQTQNCLVELIALLDELFEDLTDVHHRRITRLHCIGPQTAAGACALATNAESPRRRRSLAWGPRRGRARDRIGSRDVRVGYRRGNRGFRGVACGTRPPAHSTRACNPCRQFSRTPPVVVTRRAGRLQARNGALT